MIGVLDTTELVGPGAESADILLVAGYCLPRETLPDLLRDVREIKNICCGNSYVPIKWNLRGQRRAIDLHRCHHLEQRLLEVSDLLRQALLECLRNAKATLFLSVLSAYSYRKEVLNDIRGTLARFCFGNILMRVGLFRRNSIDHRMTEIILDWPEGGAPAPFVAEYLAGWRDGISPNEIKPIPYRCGPLKDLGFFPGPTFGVTDVDERLQLADLVVASSRSFVNYAIGRSNADEFANAEFFKLLPLFFRERNMIMGRGVTVSPINGDLSKQIYNALLKHGA
jgi:hypothetical protein